MASATAGGCVKRDGRAHLEELPDEYLLERDEADAPVTSEHEPGRGPVGRAGIPPLEDDQ